MGNAEFISSTVAHGTFFGNPPQGLRLGVRAVLHQETNDPLPRGLGKSGHTVFGCTWRFIGSYSPLICTVTLLITPFTTAHEPPNRVRG